MIFLQAGTADLFLINSFWLIATILSKTITIWSPFEKLEGMVTLSPFVVFSQTICESVPAVTTVRYASESASAVPAFTNSMVVGETAIGVGTSGTVTNAGFDQAQFKSHHVGFGAFAIAKFCPSSEYIFDGANLLK